jgi:hypothetical protein
MLLEVDQPATGHVCLSSACSGFLCLEDASAKIEVWHRENKTQRPRGDLALGEFARGNNRPQSASRFA